MGQKVNPIGFRTGITIGWKSRWFAPKSNYGEFLIEDEKIRRFIESRLNRKRVSSLPPGERQEIKSYLAKLQKEDRSSDREAPHAGITGIEIERTREEVKIILKTARPGIVIGPKGAEVDKLKSILEDMTDRRVNINIVEVRNPDLDAMLVGEGIAEQLKRRTSFRRAMKQRAESAMQSGAKGIKIQLSGRLGGAEMSRSESMTLGSVPLHTLEADIDYSFVPCFTTYGVIGVKVWIFKGLFGEQPSDEELAALQRQNESGRFRPRRRREQSDGPAGGGRGGPGQGGRSGGRAPQAQPAPATTPVAVEPVAQEEEVASAPAPAPAPEPVEEPKADVAPEKTE